MTKEYEASEEWRRKVCAQARELVYTIAYRSSEWGTDDVTMAMLDILVHAIKNLKEVGDGTIVR